MSVNKNAPRSLGKPQRKTVPNARLLNARKAALAGVRKAAFQSGASRNAVIAATFAALGKRPVLTLYNAGKLELQIGFMGAALARKGDNREPDVIMSDCRVKLASFAGFGGKGKLRKGQKGRRTRQEEEAYASARVQVSSIMREAAITVPETRGGNTSQTRKPRAGEVKKAAKAANDAKPAVRKYADKAALVAYLTIQGKAMLATLNKNAKIAPVEAKSAVQDFNASLAKLA